MLIGPFFVWLDGKNNFSTFTILTSGKPVYIHNEPKVLSKYSKGKD